MENTGKVLFPNFSDNQPQWYFAQGDRWVGPLTASDVYQKVLNQELSWADFVWKPGQAGWERICDLKTFQAAVPQLPPKTVQKEVKEAVKEAAAPAVRTAARRSVKAPAQPKAATDMPSEEKIWFVYYNESQFGPFSASEVHRYLKIGKLNGRVFGWRDGMENWERLEKITDFGELSSAKKPPAGPKTAAKAPDQRSAPRRPLVAKIVMTNQSAVAVAVCRDISVGGMQVLTDRIPGDVGARIRLNVSSTEKKIEPFTAEGVIVRILEDGRGFSFRFEKLSDSAKRNIENYISVAG